MFETAFETTVLLAIDLLFILAHLTTACLHLSWNELLTTVISWIAVCLSNLRSSVLLSLLKLHCLVMVCFVLATCFRLTTAEELQHVIEWTSGTNYTLNFDDLSTDSSGFGYVPDAYHHLNFDGLYPFDPHADSLKGKISKQDLDCAVSAPNALYGARHQSGNTRLVRQHSETHDDVPGIHIDTRSAAVFGLHPYFTLHSLKIKPLDIPLSHTTLFIKGYTSERVFHWQVDFPLGYHEILHVKMEEFSKRKWEELERLELFANLHYDGRDWEFCLDDLEIQFHSILNNDSTQSEPSTVR